jgi:CheY-like chemotaxis protein
VEIAVADTGTGIAPQQLERIFEPFERAGAEQSTVEGTGIGLTVVRALVDTMHGQIRAESTPGAGSKFRLQLPIASHGPISRLEPELASVPESPPHPTIDVLYIEDNEASRDLMQHIFRTRPNSHLRLANDGAAGLELAWSRVPDLILLDLQLPDMEGADVLEQLRSDDRTRTAPVIAVTANALADSCDRLYDLGVSHVLTKPFEISELLDLIQGLATDTGEPEGGQSFESWGSSPLVADLGGASSQRSR